MVTHASRLAQTERIIQRGVWAAASIGITPVANSARRCGQSAVRLAP